LRYGQKGSRVHRGKVGVTLVIRVYSPPSWYDNRFERQLEEIGEVIRDYLPGPIIIAGDLNAKSVWGCPRIERRGELLGEWIAGLDLTVVNVGSVSTCVRPQGESIVDLTLTSHAAAWRICS